MTHPAHAPELRGRRVVLRPLVPTDRERLASILAEPSVRRWWGTMPPDADAAELASQGGLIWAIVLDGVLVGSVQAAEEEEPDYRHAGIDLFLDTDHQGQGLGPEAIRLVARHLVEERGHHRLTIDPAAANERAIRAYERVGFRRVGVMRLYERGSDGTWHDGLLMDMLAGELVHGGDDDADSTAGDTEAAEQAGEAARSSPERGEPSAPASPGTSARRRR